LEGFSGDARLGRERRRRPAPTVRKNDVALLTSIVYKF
jgi:hypothetical protein